MTDPNRRAALSVADRSSDAADCKQLLDMLGLLNALKAEPRPKRRGRPSIDHGHGHSATYGKGCRCDECRAAHTARCRKRRADSAKDPSRADRAGHGKASTYKNHGCRCIACREANSASLAEWKHRKRVSA